MKLRIGIPACALRLLSTLFMVIVIGIGLLQGCGKSIEDERQVIRGRKQEIFYPSHSTARNAEVVQVLIAYFSRTGTIQKLAYIIADGARSVPNTKVLLKEITEVTEEILYSSDAIIVGTPVYYGGISGALKSFIDDWTLKYHAYPDYRLKDKIGAAFAAGYFPSGGKELAMLSIHSAMMNAKMIVVGGDKGIGASATGEGKDKSTELRKLEEEDGYNLGKRVAEVTHTFVKERQIMLKKGKGL